MLQPCGNFWPQYSPRVLTARSLQGYRLTRLLVPTRELVGLF